MRKPPFEQFYEFKRIFDKINKEAGLRQQIIPYFISSHPGCTEEDMAELAVITKKLDFHLEQVQDFTPTPMTVSTEAWYTGVHPYTLEPVFSAKTPRENLPSACSSSGINLRNGRPLSTNYGKSVETTLSTNYTGNRDFPPQGSSVSSMTRTNLRTTVDKLFWMVRVSTIKVTATKIRNIPQPSCMVNSSPKSRHRYIRPSLAPWLPIPKSLFHQYSVRPRPR